MRRPLTQPATFYQLIYALNNQPLGRRTLVEQTGITEMTVRTHLNKLRNAGLVAMEKSGTRLTERAEEQLESLLESVVTVQEVEVEELSLSAQNIAAQIHDGASDLKQSLRFRDAAVRAGASGAIFLIWEAGGWALAGDRISVSETFPTAGAVLQSKFEGVDNDVLVVSFGASMSLAKSGLWSVIAEMIPTDLEKMIHKESA